MTRQTVAISLGLAAAVALVYGQVVGHEFVFDDLADVVGNPHISHGLGWAEMRWALTGTHRANWIPLTWLSQMLDFELFGADPTGHHLVNVALHVANAVLLFHVLHGMTGDLRPSAVVAALFALHPLHVESVAWVAERKDVLSTLFWLLTMLAWRRWVRHPRPGRYLLVMTAFALALAAKGTPVTLPCVLVLLDVWPLGRWRRGTRLRCLAEKLPLLALSAGASVATLLAQHAGGAVQSAVLLPPVARVENALVSYAAYLGKMVWPVRLACFYPHPALGPESAAGVLWAPALAAAALLATITVVALRQVAVRPYLLVGWLWYLGTLVPNIGIVQVGQQAMADRYTYVPLVGVFVMVAWAGRDLVTSRPQLRRALIVGTFLALGACAALTSRQVGIWRDGRTLYTHALAVTTDNHLAHHNLANALLADGDVPGAKHHFAEAVRIRPTLADAHVNLGAILHREKDLEGAARHFALATRIQPDLAGAENNLGVVRLDQRRFAEAEAHFARAIGLQPDYVEAHNGLGIARLRQNRLEAAEAAFTEALRLRPRYADALSGLGVLELERRHPREAAERFREALRVAPSHDGARRGLALAERRLSGFP